MKKINLSARICDLYNSPDRYSDEFWSLVLRYVQRLANHQFSEADQDRIDDLVSVSLAWTIEHLAEYQHTQPTGFTRWVSSVVRFQAMALRKAARQNWQVPESQVDEFKPDKDAEVFSLDSLDLSGAVGAQIAVEDSPLLAPARLDNFSASLSPSGQRVLALLRQGKSVAQVAAELGVASRSVYSRIQRWSKSNGGSGSSRLERRIKHEGHSLPSSAASLHPGPALVMALLRDSPSASVILDSWRTGPPVRVVPANQLEQYSPIFL